MELNQIIDVETESINIDHSIDFSFDDASMALMFKSFTDSLYSNKIGSIVREITSNAIDANALSNSEIPVKITITSSDPLLDTKGKISFKDYGPGISPDLMKDTYSKYFASTKRNTNEQIGGWGIGAKTPLSYTNNFLLFTNFDGIEYTYLISRGEIAPQINLINQIPSTNVGTEVVIEFIKHYDESEFVKELTNQLKYFDNIDYENCEISNDYKLYHYENFVIRRQNDSVYRKDKLEISLGKVCYPLNMPSSDTLKSYLDKVDFDENSIYYKIVTKEGYSLNNNLEKFPAALKFEIGDLDVTLSRESLEYTEKTQIAILNKLHKFIEECDKIRNTNKDTIDDFDTLLEVDSTTKNYLRLPNEEIFKLNFFQNNLKIIFTPFNRSFDLSDLNYNFSGTLVQGTIKTSKYHRVNSYIRNFVKGKFYRKIDNSNTICIYYNSAITATKIEYLKELHNVKNILFVKVENNNLNNFKEVDLLEKYVLTKIDDLNSLEIPKDWLINYKAKTKKQIDTRPIRLLKVNQYNSSFNITKYTAKELDYQIKTHKICVYGTNENSEALLTFEQYCQLGYHKILVFKCTDDQLDIFSKYKKAIYIEDINKVFQKSIKRSILVNEISSILNYIPNDHRIILEKSDEFIKLQNKLTHFINNSKETLKTGLRFNDFPELEIDHYHNFYGQAISIKDTITQLDDVIKTLQFFLDPPSLLINKYLKTIKNKK